MKKFFCLLLFFVFLTCSATEDKRKAFQHYYYSGKYTEAHAILQQAFTEPLTRQIWEERLHLQEDFPGCTETGSNPSARATAMLRIGLIENAKQEFTTDWLSFLGRATIAGWQNDFQMARNYLRQAIRLHPDDSDLLYYAGTFADNDAESLDFFQRYLKSKSVDSTKKSSAKQRVEFIKKTQGVRLNLSNIPTPVETIESEFNDKRLLINAKIDKQNDVVLLLDTGAAGLSLKDRNWKARNATDFAMIGLGSKQRARGALVVFDHFSAGRFQVENPVAAISKALNGSGIDGIAGSIIFSQFNMVLPMSNDADVILSSLDSKDLLAHLESKGTHYERKVTLPFYQVGKMIILKGQIKKSDKEMDMLLDTGAQTSIVSAAAARRYVHINYPKTFREKGKVRLSGIGGGIDNIIHLDNVDIEIGPLKKSFNRMVALNLAQISETLDLEVDLILGQDFLRGYTLLLDYKNNEVTFLS